MPAALLCSSAGCLVHWHVNVEVINDLYGTVLVDLSALQVLYDVRGFLEKNRDTFRDDVLNMLKDSRYAPLMLVRRPHLLGRTKPHSCNNQTKESSCFCASIRHYSLSFFSLCLSVLAKERRAGDVRWRTHLISPSCCPSFEKSYKSMKEKSLQAMLVFCLPSSPFPLLPLTSLSQQWQICPWMSQGSLPCCQMPAFVQRPLIFQPAC